jgi:predicted DNA-binding WGR domain protein
VRRFEFIQGNQAKFWEVARRGATLTVASGRIGGAPKTRTKQLLDYMAAEQEFDRLIRDKLRRGYVEVHAPTSAEPPPADHALRLRARRGDAVLELPAAAVRYLVWRMVEVGVLDKQLPAPDLERWSYRASRRLLLEELPSPGDPRYDDFRAMMLDLSARDREAESGQHGVVGAYKLRSGGEWVVTAREAGWLADASKNRTPHRHKITTNQEHWLEEWTRFNEGEAGREGYVVELL